MIFLSRYLGEKFDLFPGALKKIDKIKGKEEWGKEIDDLLCHRMNEGPLMRRDIYYGQ
jgi:hypothetical protein